MECNREEAFRAKLIAEGKIEKKDFPGAKKFALKAKTLYPELDGITQTLTTVDVYISAENKISGEVDWYGVLSVNPSADDETIRKQYRKLALMLHPDKNRSIGADGAFKLISEAWSLLSDKAKRLLYNQRRGFGGLQHKVNMHTAGPSASARPNDIFNFATKTTQVPNIPVNVPKPKPPPKRTPTMPNKRSDTFWTVCFRCKMHYEYLKIYLNHTLLCPNCNDAFVAAETAPPFNFSKSINQAPRQQHHTSSNYVSNRNNAYDVRNVPAAKKSGLGSNTYSQCHQNLRNGKANVASTNPCVAAKAANVVQQAHDNVKRVYNESQASEGCVKNTKLDDNSSLYGMNCNNAQGNTSFRNSNASGSRIYGFSNINRRLNSTQDLTMTETRAMLTAKAQKEIFSVLRSSMTTTKAVDREKDMNKESKKQRRQNTTDNERLDQNGNTHSSESPVKEELAAASMSVPDPDFYDFDLDRSESSFGDNEVWASYDDDDGMPRFYALISKVISSTPFKLRISWINSKTTTEFGNKDWVGSGFYKTCGEFRVGRYEICKSINSFSQKVNWSKGPRGSIIILPQKGDIWAIYKNWSSDWNEHTPDEVVHKYEMVKVLDDYSEEKGVTVTPLVKLSGFKTIFRPTLDPEAVTRIYKEEMFRFSHRVPNHLITGLEGQNAPKGCLELDPAATPLELLQVITEGNVVSV
ncbi:hypothetical protein OROGR_022574 [Orobanche gracilis]